MPLADSRARSGWWVLGVAVFLTVLFVVHRFVGTFVVALFIYYSTRPIYRRLRRRGVGPRSVAAALSLLLMILPALAIGSYAGAIALQELRRIRRVTDLGPLDALVRQYGDLANTVQRPDDLFTDPAILDSIQSGLDTALASLSFVGLLVLHLFVMVAIAFYLLRDDYRLARWTRAALSDQKGIVDAYGRAVDRDLSSVFFGNILNAVITGTIGAIAFSVLNLFAPPDLAIPYAALVGLLCGVASLIPIVGMKLIYVPVGLVLLGRSFLLGSSQAWAFAVGFFVLAFVVVDTIPDLVLRPYVSGRGLHVGMVMFAYIFGPLLFGWYGLFLGPLLLVVIVHFFKIVLPELLAGETIQPYSVDPSHLDRGTIRDELLEE
jgi:predicted PurR-regulated permease PerM